MSLSLSLSLCSHIICACTTLKLILKSFSSVIVTNIRQPSTPTNGGIDIARDERSANTTYIFTIYKYIQILQYFIATK